MIPSQKNQVVNREYLLHQKGMVTKMAPLKTGVLEARACFEYVKDLVLKAGSSSYTPVTPIPLASISVDPTSQSFGEGTQAFRTVTPISNPVISLR